MPEWPGRGQYPPGLAYLVVGWPPMEMWLGVAYGLAWLLTRTLLDFLQNLVGVRG